MTEEEEKYTRMQLSLAREALVAAELLIDNQSYRAAINRLYYACFYAVSALLQRLGKSAKTHSGIKTLFNAHVIQNGLLPKEYGDLYTTLSEARHETDYTVSVGIDYAETHNWLPQVKRFIDAVEALIEARMGE